MARPLYLLDRPFAWERRLKPRRRPAQGVLIVAAGGLGDTVLFAHVLPRFLALAAPNEPVTVVLRADAAKMAFLFPKGVAVKAVDFRRLGREVLYRRRAFAEMRALGARLALSADYLRHPRLDEALIAAAEAEETIAMTPRPWPKYQAALDRHLRLYTRLFESGPPRSDKLLRWTRFANWLTGRDDPPPKARLPEALFPAKEEAAAPFVVVQPFSAVKRKQVPPSFWRALIGSLPPGVQVRLTGAPSDLAKNPEYRALLDPPRVRFDDSSFQALLPALRAARLVVSVDTALMHLAIAAGAPTLGLASAAFVGEIVPYDPAVIPENARFLYVSMPCEGCLGDCPYPPVSGMYPCVARLDAQAVAREMTAMLAR